MCIYTCICVFTHMPLYHILYIFVYMWIYVQDFSGVVISQVIILVYVLPIYIAVDVRKMQMQKITTDAGQTILSCW